MRGHLDTIPSSKKTKKDLDRHKHQMAARPTEAHQRQSWVNHVKSWRTGGNLLNGPQPTAHAWPKAASEKRDDLINKKNLDRSVHQMGARPTECHHVRCVRYVRYVRYFRYDRYKS